MRSDGPEATPVQATATPRRRGRHDAGWCEVGITVALVPVIAVVLTRVGRTYVPLGDEATIDLRVRDVFTSDTPLVGPYSRGFNHPGPLLFWVLAPLSVLTGGAAWATQVGAALAQGCAIAASGVVAFRRGGLLLSLMVLAALGAAYSSFAHGVQFLQPWNPNVAFPFFMLFLLQVWSVALGHRWQVLGAAIVGTFLVQLHVGYLPLVAAALAWAATVLALDRRRALGRRSPGHRSPGRRSQDDQPRWSRVAVVTVATAAMLWAVVLYQQLTSERGNLEALVDYFRGTQATAGIWAAGGVFGAEFRIPPPWLGGHIDLELFTDRVLPASTAWLLIPAAILLAGFAAARGSDRRADARMVQLAAVVAVTTVLAISRIGVELQDFLFYWQVIAAVFVVLASAWAMLNWLRIGERHVARAVTAGVLLVAIAGFFGARARDDVWRHRDAIAPAEEYAARLFRGAERAAPTGEPVLVRGLGKTTDGIAQGLVDALDRAGVPVRVDPEWAFQYGDGRAATRADVDEVWYVTQNGSRRALLDEQAGGRFVASVTPLRRHDELELRALRASMAAQLADAGHTDLVRHLDTSLFAAVVEHVDGLDPGDVARLSRLNRRVEASGGCRCLVVAFPADRAPGLPSGLGY